MPKCKCKFTDELKKKHPCFRLGREASEAECMTCRAGTYVSVANKGGSDLEAHVHSAKHKNAARGESSSSKVTDFFVSKTNTSVTAAEGTLAFHTIKHHNSYRSMDCTSGLLRKATPPPRHDESVLFFTNSNLVTLAKLTSRVQRHRYLLITTNT